MNYQHQCPTCHLPIPHDGVDAALPLCPNCWVKNGCFVTPATEPFKFAPEGKPVKHTNQSPGHHEEIRERIHQLLTQLSDFGKSVDSRSGVDKYGWEDDFLVTYRGKEYFITARESNRQRDLNKGEVK